MVENAASVVWSLHRKISTVSPISFLRAEDGFAVG
jgi:hypothetical protein